MKITFGNSTRYVGSFNLVDIILVTPGQYCVLFLIFFANYLKTVFHSLNQKLDHSQQHIYTTILYLWTAEEQGLIIGNNLPNKLAFKMQIWFLFLMFIYFSLITAEVITEPRGAQTLIQDKSPIRYSYTCINISAYFDESRMHRKK